MDIQPDFEYSVHEVTSFACGKPRSWLIFCIYSIRVNPRCCKCRGHFILSCESEPVMLFFRQRKVGNEDRPKIMYSIFNRGVSCYAGSEDCHVLFADHADCEGFKLHVRILTPDGLRIVCAGLDNDLEKIRKQAEVRRSDNQNRAAARFFYACLLMSKTV